MSKIRQSILWISTGQYLNLAFGIASTWFLSRLLTPAEFGVSIFGWAIFNTAESLREFASGTFLIRERDLDAESIRTSVTINVLITLVIATGMGSLARPLSRFFATPGLDTFLYVVAIAYILGAILYPQQALLNRELAFGKVALIGTAMTAGSSFVAVALAYYGFSALSFAWATVASFVIGTLLCAAARRDIGIFKPSLQSWRRVLQYGLYNGTTAMIARAAEAIPVFLLGRIWTPGQLAIASRAVLISSTGERIVFGPILAIALPEFSRQAREGRDLKKSYLRALSYISVIHWPGMLILALIAHPVVELVMGQQWLDAVPLIRIYCPALIFAVPIGFQYAMLSAVDAISIVPRLLGLQSVLMILALALTARYGVHVAAWSMYPVLITNGLLSLLVVRRKINFDWTDLMACLIPSIVTTIIAVICPLAIFLTAPRMTLLFSVAVVLVAGFGWLLGLYVSAHPMWDEVCNAARLSAKKMSRGIG